MVELLLLELCTAAVVVSSLGVVELPEASVEDAAVAKDSVVSDASVVELESKLWPVVELDDVLSGSFSVVAPVVVVS